MPSLLAQRFGAGEAPALPGGYADEGFLFKFRKFMLRWCVARTTLCAEGDGQIESVRRAYRTMLNRVPRGA